MADVVPFLGYEDPGRAADWLVRAFGFEEVERFEEDGEVTHVTLRCGDGLVFLGHPDGYVNPLHLREQSETVARMYDVPWIVDGAWVAVDDLGPSPSAPAPPARASSPSPRTHLTAGSAASRIRKGTAGCSASDRSSNRQSGPGLAP